MFQSIQHRSLLLFKLTIISFALLFHSPASANDNKTIAAFTSFLAQQDYGNANFYLQSSLIDPTRLDTGQIFYQLFRQVYWRRQAGGLGEINTLYNYLYKLKPFDLNARFDCVDERNAKSPRCTVLNDIASGMPIAVFAFFAERGLDLNRTFEDVLPASYDIIDRLGIIYSIPDIQALSRLGMVFGDESYSSVLLAAHRDYADGYYTSSREQVFDRRNPEMPQNYLSIPNFNFMDVLTIALANDATGGGRGYRARASRRDEGLCQYITFASQTFPPSFDYLRYLLKHREAFRADKIGVRIRDGNATADPFPSACVQLVAGMARNHARLDEVVSHFGAVGDVDTARWLLALRQPIATSNAAPPAMPNVQEPPADQPIANQLDGNNAPSANTAQPVSQQTNPN